MYKKLLTGDRPWTPIQFPVLPGEKVSGLFDAVFQEVDEAILIADLEDGVGTLLIADVNRTFEDWTGYSREGVCGFDLYSLLDISDAGAKALMESGISSRRAVEIDANMVSRDGTLLPVHFTMRPVTGSDGSTRYTVVLRRSEALASHALALANRERDEALKAKEQLLARVSHELRTPLNGILGYSEILKGEVMGDMDDQQRKDYASGIHTAGTELLWRIEELLQLKVVEDDDWAPNDECFNAGIVVSNVVQHIVARAEFSDLEICTEIDPYLPLLTADKNAFRKVAHAIMTDAVCASPNGAAMKVWMGLNSRGEMILATECQGQAVSLEEISSVLEMEVSDKSVYGNAQKRNMMGLYLAKKVVERHGGRMEVGQHGVDGIAISAIFPAYRVG